MIRCVLCVLITNFSISRLIEHTWSLTRYLSLTNFTISKRIEHTWSLADIAVTDELYYIKTYRTHLKFVSDRFPCQWSGVFDASWYSKVRQWHISLPMIRCVRYVLTYYIKTHRTHLIIGMEICHWGTLLYEDVSNTPDHWQGYLSLTNFTISINDQVCSIRLDIVKFVRDRYLCQWSGVFDTSWYRKVRQWQISLPMIRCLRCVLM
jgi:hypothetical protein